MSFLTRHKEGIAVRKVELSQPLRPLNDITQYSGARIFISWQNQVIGHVDVDNERQIVTVEQLQSLVIAEFGGGETAVSSWSDLLQHIAHSYPKRNPLPADVSVSIVIATFDRPDDLRACLQGLQALESPRPIEIVIVDNHPASGLTKPLITEFPDIVWVEEPRQGLAYARNAGFVASTGDITIATDDDVRLPSDWLERLLAPFADPEVMIVTGNTLPIELETESQRLYEAYGGLGKGYERIDADQTWFDGFRTQGVPTWRLGATANAAFRSTIFHHPEIGLMDEALGPGMPSGVGEDTYLFYKTLRAGYKLVYEPASHVWHRHRREMVSLRRQLYGYSKGHIAYHLTTFLRDRDWRALLHIFVLMPPWQVLRILRLLLATIRGTAEYSLSLLLLGVWGSFLGPWVLWQSRRRVKEEGKSAPYFDSAFQ